MMTTDEETPDEDWWWLIPFAVLIFLLIYPYFLQ